MVLRGGGCTSKTHPLASSLRGGGGCTASAPGSALQKQPRGQPISPAGCNVHAGGCPTFSKGEQEDHPPADAAHAEDRTPCYTPWEGTPASDWVSSLSSSQGSTTSRGGHRSEESDVHPARGSGCTNGGVRPSLPAGTCLLGLPRPIAMSLQQRGRPSLAATRSGAAVGGLHVQYTSPHRLFREGCQPPPPAKDPGHDLCNDVCPWSSHAQTLGVISQPSSAGRHGR